MWGLSECKVSLHFYLDKYLQKYLLTGHRDFHRVTPIFIKSKHFIDRLLKLSVYNTTDAT